MTAWDELLACSSLNIGDAWTLITHPNTGSGGTLITGESFLYKITEDLFTFNIKDDSLKVKIITDNIQTTLQTDSIGVSLSDDEIDYKDVTC